MASKSIGKQKKVTLSYQTLLHMLKTEEMKGITNTSIQAASIDLPLTSEIYRMPGSTLPESNETVRDLISSRSLYTVEPHQQLELDCYYLVRTKLTLNLPNNIVGNANNKSSSGRINLQGRLVLDKVSRYDTIPTGYKGEVWVELHPKLCPVKLDFSEDGAVNQIRLRNNTEEFCISKAEILKSHKETPFLFHRSGEPFEESELEFTQDGRGLLVKVDLNPNNPGFQGLQNRNFVLDLQSREQDRHALFREIYLHHPHRLWMHHDEFYILGSQAKISNPPNYCIYMLPYQVEHGEFRSHYAGFFDPGNGYGRNGEIKGFAVTLEVIPIEDAIEVKTGQIMFAIQIDRMDKKPEKLYGVDFKSNYFSNPGPKLAKFFKP